MPSIGGVAAQIALVAACAGLRAITTCPSVKTIVIGGGPSPPEIVREARARFGAAYSIRYSSTESGGVGTATAFDAPDDEALYTVGRPRPGVEVRIDDDSGELLLRSTGDDDGLLARSRRARRPRSSTAGCTPATSPQWDDQGCLRIVGRTTDMYIRGGYNVHPQEVEAVLVEHPAVARGRGRPTRYTTCSARSASRSWCVAAGSLPPDARRPAHVRGFEARVLQAPRSDRRSSTPSPSRRWTSSTAAPSRPIRIRFRANVGWNGRIEPDHPGVRCTGGWA